MQGWTRVKFGKQVVPGDQLVMTATFVKRRDEAANEPRLAVPSCGMMEP